MYAIGVPGTLPIATRRRCSPGSKPRHVDGVVKWSDSVTSSVGTRNRMHVDPSLLLLRSKTQGVPSTTPFCAKLQLQPTSPRASGAAKVEPVRWLGVSPACFGLQLTAVSSTTLAMVSECQILEGAALK